MTKEQFRERLAQGKMILDGATGSNLVFRREYALRSGY